MDMCTRCLGGARGDVGHAGLHFYVGGPFPGQSIFKCQDCGDRWIRHHSLTEKYGWTRYFLQFAGQRHAPDLVGRKSEAARG